MPLKFESANEPRMRAPGERLYLRLSRLALSQAELLTLAMAIRENRGWDALPDNCRRALDGAAAMLGLGAKVE